MKILIDVSLAVPVIAVSSNLKTWDLFVEASEHSTVFSEIHKLLKIEAHVLSEIEVNICFGPGSYTGLKLAQIINEVFRRANITTKTFYHFDLLNTSICNYVCRAYKGQFFLFQLQKDPSAQSELINEEKLLLYLEKKFLTQENTLSRDIVNFNVELLLMRLFYLECENFWHAMSKVAGNRAKVYYFRPDDVEYHVSFK